MALYERFFALSLGENVDEGISDTARRMASQLIDYDNAPKRNFFQQLLNRNIMKDGRQVLAKDQILDNIVTQYSDARKMLDSTYGGLLTTNMRGALKKPNKISSLVRDFSNFGRDVQKTM